MKFCFAYPDYPIGTHGGGTGTYAQIVAQELVKAGHEVFVVTLPVVKDNEQKHFTDGQVKVICSKRPGSIHWYLQKIPILSHLALAIRELEWSYALWAALRPVQKNQPFDIIECAETGGFFISLFRKKRSKVVVKLHGERYTYNAHTPGGDVSFRVRLERSVQLKALKNVDLLLSPCNHHAQVIEGELAPDKRQIITVYNMLTEDRIQELSQTPKTRETGFRIVLWTGRIELRKGIWDFLEAARIVSKAVPNVQFMMTGAYHPSIKRELVKQFIETNQLQDHVKILGSVDPSRLVELYQQATVFAMPTYYECFGYSFLEAMIAYKPVVGYAGSSLEEVVDDGHSGYVAERGNIETFAQAIIKLLRDDKLAKQMGGEGHRQSVEKFSSPAIIPSLLKIYDNLLVDKQAQSRG